MTTRTIFQILFRLFTAFWFLSEKWSKKFQNLCRVFLLPDPLKKPERRGKTLAKFPFLVFYLSIDVDKILMHLWFMILSYLIKNFKIQISYQWMDAGIFIRDSKLYDHEGNVLLPLHTNHPTNLSLTSTANHRTKSKPQKIERWFVFRENQIAPKIIKQSQEIKVHSFNKVN